MTQSDLLPRKVTVLPSALVKLLHSSKQRGNKKTEERNSTFTSHDAVFYCIAHYAAFPSPGPPWTPSNLSATFLCSTLAGAAPCTKITPSLPLLRIAEFVSKGCIYFLVTVPSWGLFSVTYHAAVRALAPAASPRPPHPASPPTCSESRWLL